MAHGPGPGDMGVRSRVGGQCGKPVRVQTQSARPQILKYQQPLLPHRGVLGSSPSRVRPRARRPTDKGHVEERAEPEQWAMGTPEESQQRNQPPRSPVGNPSLTPTSHSHLPPLICPYLCPRSPGKVEWLLTSPSPFISPFWLLGQPLSQGRLAGFV